MHVKHTRNLRSKSVTAERLCLSLSLSLLTSMAVVLETQRHAKLKHFRKHVVTLKISVELMLYVYVYYRTHRSKRDILRVQERTSKHAILYDLVMEN